ncbi:Zn-dependent hydrolase [Orrella daihaiensis]|uniref:Zn-dependent hydrolase n=2 Tax=Orrella daihaiensis TaxID=2782176 RepID=A0ABY4AMH7_9BURK|nr:Zn-dependent hydrolase [Orrella daihaiensis]
MRIDGDRLLSNLKALAKVGARPDGSCCRLALTDEDRDGRDLVVQWMKDAGLSVSIDPIGNVFGRRAGKNSALAPVMTGSHTDTVRTGGAYDGNLGVLGGLEVVAALNQANVQTERDLVVGIFTNEEGARFAPDMLGSLVYAGGLPLQDALQTKSIDGAVLGDELKRIGYAGTDALGLYRPHAFVELHIEQGPVLDIEGTVIGAVQNLQGISWQEVTIVGQSNHAGTTPMRMRHDAGYVAASIATFVRELTKSMGGDQVGTVGKIDLTPNLINVIAARAVVTVDLRNTDEDLLQEAEARFAEFLKGISASEGVEISTRRLARFEPVLFDQAVVEIIEQQAELLGLSCRRMTSGAGHDAQMLARICPSAMIFVPSIGGISHNPAEHTEPADLLAGCNVLLHTLIQLLNQED